MVQELRTERLRLRPLTMSDLAVVSEIEAGVDHREYLGGSDNQDTTRRGLQRRIDEYSTRGYGLLGVVFANGETELIGLCGLIQSQLAEGKDVELLCSLKAVHCGHGLGFEACQAVMAWGLDQLQLDRILGRVADGNERSRRVVQKVGMRFLEDRTDLQTGKHEQVFVAIREVHDAVELSGG